MIIEFPKKYSVEHLFENTWRVSIPVDYQHLLEETLGNQPWISRVPKDAGGLYATVNTGAYEITQAQAQEALERICEHVMAPPPEVDEDVWGEVMEDGE